MANAKWLIILPTEMKNLQTALTNHLILRRIIDSTVVDYLVGERAELHQMYLNGVAAAHFITLSDISSAFPLVALPLGTVGDQVSTEYGLYKALGPEKFREWLKEQRIKA